METTILIITFGVSALATAFVLSAGVREIWKFNEQEHARRRDEIMKPIDSFAETVATEIKRLETKSADYFVDPEGKLVNKDGQKITQA